MGYVHNRDDAEDLTQEVFIKAYLSSSEFRQESSFSTWLYRIAVNMKPVCICIQKHNFILINNMRVPSCHRNKIFI